MLFFRLRQLLFKPLPALCLLFSHGKLQLELFQAVFDRLCILCDTLRDLLHAVRIRTGVDVYTHSEMLPAHYYPTFKKYPNFIYIDMDGNKGIAAALNKGIEYLDSKNMDFALTMDQDSLFPTKYYPNILKLVDKYKEE